MKFSGVSLWESWQGFEALSGVLYLDEFRLYLLRHLNGIFKICAFHYINFHEKKIQNHKQILVLSEWYTCSSILGNED